MNAVLPHALLGLALFAALSCAPPDKEKNPAEVPAVNVKVLTVTAQPELLDEFALPATVEANRVVDVAAEVAGRIERIRCREGSACKAGDELIELNTDLLKAEYDSAAARANHAVIKFKRISNLLKQGSGTDRDRDQAEADLATTQAAAAAAKARLDRAKIVAPIGGVLDDVPVEMGEYVQPGMTVARIVDIDTVKVVVQMPERDVQYMRTGAEARVIARAKESEVVLSGRITYISELADPRTRSTRMEISVDNGERLLRSGQIVRARLTRRVLKDVIMVPLAAVIPMEEGKVVYVVNSDKAQRREVEIGLIRGREVRILSGLEPGYLLIVAGHRFVGPGQHVRVVTEDTE